VTVRAEGQFTAAEVEALSQKVAWLTGELERNRARLAERRAAAAEGTAEAASRVIGSAFRDEAFMAALKKVDAAAEDHSVAERAFKRCNTHGRLTKTAQARKDAVGAAASRLSEAAAAYEVERARLEVPVPPRLVSSRASWLKSQLRQLLASYKDGDYPRLIAEGEVALADAAERKRLALERLVPEHTLRLFSLNLGQASRKLLRKLADGYHPKGSTIKKKREVYDPLADLGLITPVDDLSDHQYPSVTVIGRAVARWILDNVGGTVSHRAALTRAEVLKTFTHDQIDHMTEAAQAALKTADDGGLPTQVELGLPGEGFSYRINHEPVAVQRFLRAIGYRAPKRKNGAGPTMLRRKRPDYSPGRFVEYPAPSLSAVTG